MYDVEPIINARLKFFRKRNIYYSGWSMADWWDEKLRAEENDMKEKQKLSGEDEDKRVVIGSSQPERMRLAAMREISFHEKVPEWSKRLTTKRVKCLKDLPVLAENCLSDRNIGHLNMTPAKFKCPNSQATPRTIKRCRPAERPRPHLPIILHWQKMDKTTAYPQIRVGSGMAKCGYYTG